MHGRQLLKKDLFGEIWLQQLGEQRAILRDAHAARWWVRPLAKALLRREARALAALHGLHGVPRLLHVDRSSLTRSYLEGKPLFEADHPGRDYFVATARLLRSIHRRGVAHNDLAKEPNLLVGNNGQPALIDFQLAVVSKRRSKMFRIAAREDLRHLMKHKRSYAPDALTNSQVRMLESPSLPASVIQRTVKPLYLFVTRRLLHWSDREGAADRGRQD